MLRLIKNISSLVTVNAQGALEKTGEKMGEIGEIPDGAMLFDEESIKWVGPTAEAEKIVQRQDYTPGEVLDGRGKTIMPGFVDSHTHFVFAGNRSREFARRLRGVSYQQIAEEGGGILTTMKATRGATIDELADTGRKLAHSAMKYGTTGVEIKSGYGLTTESELNQLRAAAILKEELPMHISTTFLGAHDFPPEYKQDRQKYIDIIKNEMLPRVIQENLAEYCDAFIDKGYYTLDEGEQILQAGLDHGLKLKVHADELADVSAAKLAAKLGAVSADHLLFISDESIDAMIEARTVATLLPGTAYFIRMPYAPARKLIDKGAIVALSTDCNPGSSFTENMQTVLSLAVINMAMTAEEAITAATLNGARAIEQSAVMGSLEIGKLANFIVCDVSSYTDIFYHFGINHVSETWIKGNRIV
ncbi:MAG: imidazolonepropionase [Candidatus Kapaibacterium sp.]